MSDTHVLKDHSEALVLAAELEKVLMKIGNGEARPADLPLEAMTKLIAFTRYGRTKGATLLSDDGIGPFTKHTCPSLAKAGDDEPIFVIRAQDLSSDETVQAWIDKNEDRLGFRHAKIVGAIRTRDAMSTWPTRKAAD